MVFNRDRHVTYRLAEKIHGEVDMTGEVGPDDGVYWQLGF